MGLSMLYLGGMSAQWMRTFRLMAEIVASSSPPFSDVTALAYFWLMGEVGSPVCGGWCWFWCCGGDDVVCGGCGCWKEVLEVGGVAAPGPPVRP